MSKKSVRRSITMTQEMRDRLGLLVSKQPRDTSEADLIREAVRLYLDNQEDIIGSRKHFQKSLQERLDRLESVFSFHLNVLIYLLAALEPEGSPERIADAIIAARRDGETLLAQMQAVREMKAGKR
jgi:Arc/MetJ-type ribon-helix-helix transcriptional regulator